MSNTATIIFQITMLAAAILYGIISARFTIFPEEAKELQERKGQQAVASIKNERAAHLQPQKSDIAVWGQGQEQTRQTDIEEGGSVSGWVVTLEKEGWILSKGSKEQWLFAGVVQLQKENVAVFHNKEGNEKLRMIKKESFFDNLLLSTITHEKIHLTDPEGKEWVLGLFNLKMSNTNL